MNWVPRRAPIFLASVGVGEIEGVGTTLGEGVGVGVTAGVGVGIGVVAGAAFAIVIPLFQTSFLPLFTQVNFLPLAVVVDPDFLQISPALTAAMAFIGTRIIATAIKNPSTFFICKG